MAKIKAERGSATKGGQSPADRWKEDMLASRARNPVMAAIDAEQDKRNAAYAAARAEQDKASAHPGDKAESAVAKAVGWDGKTVVESIRDPKTGLYPVGSVARTVRDAQAAKEKGINDYKDRTGHYPKGSNKGEGSSKGMNLGGDKGAGGDDQPRDDHGRWSK